jgi:Ribonuclease toxin, BrnT, of type II toxin-antitoxin system
MEFEWDPQKPAANAKKHGIEFSEAMTVFADPLELTIADFGPRKAHERHHRARRMRPANATARRRRAPEVRGKHYKAYQAGINVVFLEPDIAAAFPDSASVNQALRLLVRLSKSKARDSLRRLWQRSTCRQRP